MANLETVAPALLEALVAFEPEAAEARRAIRALEEELATLDEGLTEDWNAFVARLGQFTAGIPGDHDGMVGWARYAIGALTELAVQVEREMPTLRDAVRRVRDGAAELDDRLGAVAANVTLGFEQLTTAMTEGLSEAATAALDALEPPRETTLECLQETVLPQLVRLESFDEMWTGGVVNGVGAEQGRLNATHAGFAERVGEAQDLVAGLFVRPRTAATGVLVAGVDALMTHVTEANAREHRAHAELLDTLVDDSCASLARLDAPITRAGAEVETATGDFETLADGLARAYESAAEDLEALIALLARYALVRTR